MARRRGAFPMCHNTQNRPGGARVAALSAPMRALTGALASLTKTIQALPSLAPLLQHPLTAFARLKSGSHTPKGNFSSKRGNKGFYKGKGDKKYGKATSKGARRPRCRPCVAHTRSLAHRTLRTCCRPLGSDQAG